MPKGTVLLDSFRHGMTHFNGTSHRAPLGTGPDVWEKLYPCFSALFFKKSLIYSCV